LIGSEAAPVAFPPLGSDASTYHSRGHSMRRISPQKKRNNSNADFGIFRHDEYIEHMGGATLPARVRPNEYSDQRKNRS
jgi:hypothetical protein